MHTVTLAEKGWRRGLLATLLLGASVAWAATSINSDNRAGYGANVGWVDWRGDTNHGAVIGSYICSGYIYAANLGWIGLGSGTPANGIRYQNLAANDFGVNHDGAGNLRGLAWGANVGWVNFENSGAPRVDLNTGKLSGSIYGANCGWIGLSNAFALVQTDTLEPGQMDTNGLPVAWELENFGYAGVDPNADPDGDDVSNQQEYLAGTHPNDPNDKLQITAFGVTSDGTAAQFTWKSVPNRFYYLEESLDLSSPAWADSGLGLIAPDGAATTRGLAALARLARFYRVRAVQPLAR